MPVKSFYQLKTNYDFWKRLYLVSRVFSWIRLKATDNHNEYNKTTAVRISDQKKSLYLISFSCYIADNFHLTHQISNTNQILILVWNY